MTGVGFGVETIRRLLETPKVIGLKDSGRDMTYLHTVWAVIAQRPDFSLLVGPEELLAEAVLLGAHGGMCGGANMVPRLYVDLYDAARAGDRAADALAHEEAARFYEMALQSLDFKAAGPDTDVRRNDLHHRRARSFGALGQWAHQKLELERALECLDPQQREKISEKCARHD